MALTDTDLLLVNRSSTSYYVPASSLMTKLASADLMLVNRSSQSYAETGANVRNNLVGITRIKTPEILSPSASAGITDVSTAVSPA